MSSAEIRISSNPTGDIPMSNTRVVLVTGGMGGLGETISTKMADAG